MELNAVSIEKNVYFELTFNATFLFLHIHLKYPLIRFPRKLKFKILSPLNTIKISLAKIVQRSRWIRKVIKSAWKNDVSDPIVICVWCVDAHVVEAAIRPFEGIGSCISFQCNPKVVLS